MPLEEPDYDFAEFREWCETFNVQMRWVAFDFIQWLYSPHNTRGSRVAEGKTS